MRRNEKIASRLKHRITFQMSYMVADNTGGYIQNWKDFITVWAEVQPRSGSESLADEQVQASRRIVVTMRYKADINNDMRIKFGNRLFNITSILNPYEENMLLEVAAQEEDVR